MKAQRQHPPWTGRIQERRRKGLFQPQADQEYVLTRGSEHVEERYSAEDLGDLVAGVRVFRRLVAEIQRKNPGLELWEAQERARTGLAYLDRQLPLSRRDLLDMYHLLEWI